MSNEQRVEAAPQYSPDGRWRWDGGQWMPAPLGPPARAGGRLPQVVLGIGVASLVATCTGWLAFATAGVTWGSLDSLFAVIMSGFVLGPVLGAFALAFGLTARQQVAAFAGGVCGAVALVAAALFWIPFLLV